MRRSRPAALSDPFEPGGAPRADGRSRIAAAPAPARLRGAADGRTRLAGAAARFFESPRAHGPSAAQELAASLTAAAASIAPKFFYDALGSRLFAAICELPEYYPTRTERAILQERREAVAAAVGRGGTLIDLGAGDCAKAESLFPALAPAQYVAVDVSVAFLREALDGLARRHPGLDAIGVGTDFSAALWLPEAVSAARRTFFYPGSSIGNFDPAGAAAFLRGLRAQAGADGGLLIGVDLVKPRQVLERAYDDALGVTAAFDRNVLLHANRRLGADFDPADWSHVALWNEADSRIEMHLQARRPLAVRWPGGERRFAAGERIHTENSYKYAPGAFESLLAAAGWRVTQRWTDAQGWFAVMHARCALFPESAADDDRAGERRR